MFEIAEFIGIVAFSVSGFFVGTRNNLDMLGVLTATFLTALGGGIARDVTVNVVPYTFSNTLPSLLVVSILILLILFKFHKKASIENKSWFVLSDSIGLISFSITGSLIALQHDFNLAGVMVLSFLTATGGGIARDVIINEVPFVLKTGFYGTIALVIAIILYVVDAFYIINSLALVVIFSLALILRLVAFYKKWAIPMP